LPAVPVIGGMASAGAAPGQNTLILNDETFRAGGVGVSVRGNVTIDTLVSQGCRPIGKPLVVTGAQRNVIKTLSGRPAMEALREVIEGLSEQDRALLPKGVFIGRVINEYKERFGRGDFLIRGVLGADEKSGAIAVADAVRVGMTVQFHLRDATTASEDLELLLAAQSMNDPPVGGLLFTCNGRGRRLFERADHDAATISGSFSPTPEWFALSGFFASGEIGPIGDSSFLHGHTACLALFRPGPGSHLVG
jgi:small ligand-binding sensory domain FIST